MNQETSESIIDPIESVTYRSNCLATVDADLRNWLQQQGWSCRTWTDAPDSEHPPHDHPYGHRVLCASGWIRFTVGDDAYRLDPGDALDLPRRVEHGAVTSPDGPTEYWLLRPE